MTRKKNTAAKKELSYSEKLKDPRWQKKRLKILERDDWACIKCGSKDKELHVHHTDYIGGHDPWDYPESMLRTLCKTCHEEESDTKLRKHLIENINISLKFLDLNELRFILDYALVHDCLYKFILMEFGDMYTREVLNGEERDYILIELAGRILRKINK